MTLDEMSAEALRALADDVASGRVRVAAAVPEADVLGMTGPQLAFTLRALAREREARRRARDDISLVWTGPEMEGAQTRDTQVVVQELFERATRSVLVASYCVYQWDHVFGPLAARMAARPELGVRMFLHVDPPAHGATEAQSLAGFASGFMQRWPGARRPQVFYDPRTLRADGGQRVSLHAKCIVVDERLVFVTSANFTEAAQQRNVEAGILLSDATVARALLAQFENLVAANAMKPVPGIL